MKADFNNGDHDVAQTEEVVSFGKTLSLDRMKRYPSITPILQISSLFMAALFLTGSVRPGELLLDQSNFYRAEGREAQLTGDLDTAEASYRKAIINNPYFAEAYVDLGVILESRGKADAAEEAYKSALMINPKLAAAYTNLGLLYERQGKIKEAGEQWQTRVKLGPEADPWVEKTREKLRKYNLPVPESPEFMKKKRADEIHRAYEAGKLHLKAKQWQQAAAEFKRVLELEPSHKGALKGMKEAVAGLQAEASGEQDPQKMLENAYQAGLVYLKAGKLDQAEAEFQKVLALNPDHKGAAKGLLDVQQAREKWKVSPQQDARLSAMDAALLGEGATGQVDQAKRWAEEAARKAEDARRRLEAAKKSADESDRLLQTRQTEFEKWKTEEAKRARLLKEAEEAKKQAGSRTAEDAKRVQVARDVEAAKKQAQEAGAQAEKAQKTAEVAKKTAQGANREGAVRQADEVSRRATEAKQVSDAAIKEADMLQKQLGVSAGQPEGSVIVKGQKKESVLPVKEAKPAKADKESAFEAAAQIAASKKEVAQPPKKEVVSAAPVGVKSVANDIAKDKTKVRLQTIRELYQRGVAAMRQGKYDEAVTNFEQILALDPNHPEAKQGLKRAQVALSKSTK